MYRAIGQRHAPIIGPNTAAHYDHKTKRKAEATKVESLNTDASGRRIAKHSAPSLFLRLTITIGESTTTAGICYPRWSNPAPKECHFEQKLLGVRPRHALFWHAACIFRSRRWIAGTFVLTRFTV